MSTGTDAEITAAMADLTRARATLDTARAALTAARADVDAASRRYEALAGWPDRPNTGHPPGEPFDVSADELLSALRSIAQVMALLGSIVAQKDGLDPRGAAESASGILGHVSRRVRSWARAECALQRGAAQMRRGLQDPAN